MSAFSADEQKLYDWLRSALPRYLFQDDAAAEEIWGAIVKGLQPVREQVDGWLAETFILTSDGMWLNQHARDRGTFRQEDETDVVLRDRLRTIEDAVTPTEILAAINALLDAAGVAGDAFMVELRRDKAHMGTWTLVASGTGGTFGTDGNGTASFTPTALPWSIGWPLSSGGEAFMFSLVITGAAAAANNTPVISHDFLIQGLDGDAVTYDYGSEVAGLDATVLWEVHRYVAHGPPYLLSASVEALPPTGAGRKMAYLSRGYRIAKGDGWPSGFIIILPWGTDEATALAAAEALRKKAAGGFKRYVERRASPP